MKNRSDRLLSIDCERLDMPLLESGGWHDIESAIPSIPRMTPAFHVTYLARQEATWRVEPDHRLWIQAGQLGLIQPHSRHQGAWAADHPNQHFWFYFRPNACGAQRHTPFTREWLDAIHLRLGAKGHAVVQAPQGFKMLVAGFLQRLQSTHDHDYLWLRSVVAQIFLASVEALTEPSVRPSPETERIFGEVEARLLEWPHVAAVAEFFAMEPSYFQRLFKKATGMSPWNYILRARCRHACDQLRHSPSSVTSIAYDLGFSSSQHFSTVFRRLTGHTPGEFRRLHHAT